MCKNTQCIIVCWLHNHRPMPARPPPTMGMRATELRAGSNKKHVILSDQPHFLFPVCATYLIIAAKHLHASMEMVFPDSCGFLQQDNAPWHKANAKTVQDWFENNFED